MHKQLLLLFTFILCITSISVCQVQTGGNIGINVVNNNLIIDIAPEIGYSITDEVSAGVSPFVLYQMNLSSTVSNTRFGLRTFGEYTFEQGIFAHAEYEISSSISGTGINKIIQAAPIGCGFETDVSSNAVAFVMVLYDVLYKAETSIRKNPIIRAGIRYKF